MHTHGSSADARQCVCHCLAGSHNTCAAAVRTANGGVVELVANEHGSLLTPSAVAFTQHGVLVGQDATFHASTQPGSTIYSAKRLMGRTPGDPISHSFALMPYPLLAIGGASGQARLGVGADVHGQMLQFLPEEISALILAKVRLIVEEHLTSAYPIKVFVPAHTLPSPSPITLTLTLTDHAHPHPIQVVVVTVPAQFSRSQRAATVAACRIAGLPIVRLVTEPVAAAFAYMLVHLEHPSQVSQDSPVHTCPCMSIAGGGACMLVRICRR